MKLQGWDAFKFCIALEISTQKRKRKKRNRKLEVWLVISQSDLIEAGLQFLSNGANIIQTWGSFEMYLEEF